jgi:hypothetical protein
MSDLDRRSVLRHLNDEQYDDIMRTCECYPLVNMDVKIKSKPIRLKTFCPKIKNNQNLI